MSDFKAKMQQIQLRLGLCPRPRWGRLQRPPPHLLVGFKGFYFQVQGGEWKGKEWTGRQGRELRDGRGGERISEILNTPLFAAERIFVAPPYYSQHAVFASL